MRILFAALVAASSLSAAAIAAQTPVIGPGDPALDTRRLVDRSRDLEFQMLAAAGDSVTTRAALYRSERLAGTASAPRLVVEYRYAPSIGASDSLVLDRATLMPVTEALRLTGRTITLAYAAMGVSIVIRSDTGGAPVNHFRPLANPAFAFNEREVVIRSLPLRPGFQAIIPLFSEVDEAVEMDSVSVLEQITTAAARPGWRVRFADPAIVVTYEIDDETRGVLSESVVQRQSGRRMRYVPVKGDS